MAPDHAYVQALPGAEIAYAGKAFLCRAMATWISQEGLSLDVCSAGELLLPADTRPGDLLAVPGTGAYNHSMASNYNLVGRPPVIAVRDGAARVLVRRETEDDLLRRDINL